MSIVTDFAILGLSSLSARRVWIEIYWFYAGGHSQPSSLSARRVWIEIVQGFCESDKKPSLSARRVWIEMSER